MATINPPRGSGALAREGGGSAGERGEGREAAEGGLNQVLCPQNM